MQLAFNDGSHIVDNPAQYAAAHHRLRGMGALGNSGTIAAAMVRRVASKMKPKRKRKRNLEVGLPKNQFINAKVRMKGGKIQVMADERVLGKAGFKAGAGLSGVSVSGGVKLNPRKRRRGQTKKSSRTRGKTRKTPQRMKRHR